LFCIDSAYAIDKLLTQLEIQLVQAYSNTT